MCCRSPVLLSTWIAKTFTRFATRVVFYSWKAVLYLVMHQRHDCGVYFLEKICPGSDQVIDLFLYSSRSISSPEMKSRSFLLFFVLLFLQSLLANSKLARSTVWLQLQVAAAARSSTIFHSPLKVAFGSSGNEKKGVSTSTFFGFSIPTSSTIPPRPPSRPPPATYRSRLQQTGCSRNENTLS
jgi:hypothetical protein